MSSKKQTKTVAVILAQGHTHAGVDYKPGAQLDVAPHVAAYLERRGKAERRKP